MKVYRTFFVNSLYLYLLQGSNYLLPFLVLPYLISVLGVESFGIFGYSQAFVQILMIIIDFGFNLSVSKRISYLNKNSKELPDLYWLITAIKFGLLIIVSVFVFLFFETVSSLHIYKSSIYVSLLGLLGGVFFPVWLYQGLNEMKTMTIINVMSKLVSLPFIFIFVKSGDDYMFAAFIHSLGFFFAGLISFCLLMKSSTFRKISWENFNRQNITKQLHFAWPIFLSNASTTLYTNSLTVILGFYANTSQLGIFSAIERALRVICFGIYIPLNQAAFPIISRLKHANYQEAKQLFGKVFYSLASVMMIISLTVMCCAPFFTHYLFHDFHNVSILQIAIISIVPISLGGLCGQLGLIALGNSRHSAIYSRVYTLIGIISLPISLIAIKFFLVEGAVFSLMITEFAVFICMYISVKRHNLI